MCLLVLSPAFGGGLRTVSAGCQFYRIRAVADALNKHYGDELEYKYGSIMKPGDRDWADVVVGQRVCLPGPSQVWQQWAREGSKRLVSDLDDDLYSVREDNRNASAIFNNPEYRKRLTDNLLVSDLITVSTEPLKQAVHKNTGVELDRIVVVPNAIPPELVVDRVMEFDEASPDLGWLASPTHHADAKMVARYIRRYMESNPQAAFHTIGYNYGAMMGVSEAQSIHSQWIKKPEDAIRRIDYRVSLCPLEASVFNVSKSSCKWLEASARGTASVVSDVSAYAEVEHGTTGYKVRYEHEWSKALREVTGNEELRHSLASQAHAYVRDHRTTDNTAPEWRAAILGE